METSESVAKVAGAFVKAQKAFPTVAKKHTAKVKGRTKDGRDYEYNYQYADLADVFDAIREPLAANGLAIVQAIVGERLETRLIHESGEWMQDSCPLSSYDKPQDQGGEITYKRRYALGSFLGLVTDEDDDAAGTQAAEAKAPQASRGAWPSCPKCKLNDRVVHATRNPEKGAFGCKRCGQQFEGE